MFPGVALADFTMRGKEHLVVLHPHTKGLMLHTMYYADEIPIDGWNAD